LRAPLQIAGVPSQHPSGRGAESWNAKRDASLTLKSVHLARYELLVVKANNEHSEYEQEDEGIRGTTFDDREAKPHGSPYIYEDYQLHTPRPLRLKPLLASSAGIIFFLLCPSQVEATPIAFSVKSFGAVGDGQHDDTGAIQSTIDRAAQTGGVVLLPPGTYLSGPLYLKTNEVFDVEPNAILLASSDHTQFGEPANANTRSTGPSLLNALNQQNITITGGGTIDGNGSSWWALVTTAEKALPVPLRPKLIYLANCNHVIVRGITLQNSPSYHLVPFFCEDVLADHVTVQAPSDSPNTDGIDPICSHNVVISSCSIDTGDDDISIKTDGVVDPDATPNPTADSSQILITGCTILHGHGLSIGSVTTGGVHDVVAENCTFQNTENGLRIKSGRDRGGKVQRILYRNMQMQNVSPAITFTSFYTGPIETTPAPITSTTPFYTDIAIIGLRAAGGSVAASFVGLPEAPYTNILLADVQISATTGVVVENASLTVDNVQVTVQQGPAYILMQEASVNPISLPLTTSQK
jgi:polygalacturonase